jgi:hypothetical protein
MHGSGVKGSKSSMSAADCLLSGVSASGSASASLGVPVGSKQIPPLAHGRTANERGWGSPRGSGNGLPGLSDAETGVMPAAGSSGRGRGRWGRGGMVGTLPRHGVVPETKLRAGERSRREREAKAPDGGSGGAASRYERGEAGQRVPSRRREVQGAMEDDRFDDDSTPPQGSPRSPRDRIVSGSGGKSKKRRLAELAALQTKARARRTIAFLLAAHPDTGDLETPASSSITVSPSAPKDLALGSAAEALRSGELANTKSRPFTAGIVERQSEESDADFQKRLADARKHVMSIESRLRDGEAISSETMAAEVSAGAKAREEDAQLPEETKQAALWHRKRARIMLDYNKHSNYGSYFLTRFQNEFVALARSDSFADVSAIAEMCNETSVDRTMRGRQRKTPKHMEPYRAPLPSAVFPGLPLLSGCALFPKDKCA